jgi:hypothetical protein
MTVSCLCLCCLALLVSPLASAAADGAPVASGEQVTATSVAPQSGAVTARDDAAAQVAQDAAPVVGTEAVGTEAVGTEAVGTEAVGTEALLVEGDALRQRVQSRWAAMIDNDFHRAYEFCSPAYRALYTAKQYVSRYGSPRLSWDRVEVLTMQPVDAETAKVKIKVFANVFVPESKKPVPAASVFAESWVRADGQWWYVPAGK